MDKDILKGKVTDKSLRYLPKKENPFLIGLKISLGIILGLSFFFGIVFAVGFHQASEILPGVFQGNYKFNGSVNITNSLQIAGYNLTPVSSNTIYFNNSMTASDIQNIIDLVPKYIPQGTILYFQFKDGTYDLSESLSFNGFYGGGQVYIQGNRSETNANSLHLTQQVFLNFTSASTHGLYINSNSAFMRLYNLKIQGDTASTRTTVTTSSNSGPIFIYYNYIFGNSNAGGSCVNFNYNRATISQTYVGGCAMGIDAINEAYVFSNNNDDDPSNLPGYGIRSFYGSTVVTYGTNQPSGSSGSTTSGANGEIR